MYVLAFGIAGLCFYRISLFGLPLSPSCVRSHTLCATSGNKVQEIELAALEKHCESLPNVLAQLIPKGMNLKPPTEQVDELDMNPNRSVEVDFVDYLYRMSSSSGSEEGGAVDDSDGGALLSNDGDDYDGGDGGSWE